MSRNRLHTSKLEDFAAYCERIGWARETPKGEYEVLRMTRTGSLPLIVHTKLATSAGNAPVHLTLHGAAERMFDGYQRAQRGRAG
jgi:hypothetical protein